MGTVSKDDPTWIQAVARYQALYARQPFDRASVEPKQAREMLAAFAAQGGGRVSIPDLRPLGLTLRRVQRLTVHDRPLIHMEYLAAHGMPMSLCVLAAGSVDAALVTRSVDGMGVSIWRRGGFEFALVSDRPPSELAGIASKAASGELPWLYQSGDS
jgi:hypothetical protein